MSNGASVSRLWVFRVIVMTTAIAVAMMGSELGLRLMGWPAPGYYVNGSGPEDLRLPDRHGGAFPPNTAGRLRHYDYDIEWSVNTDGFRERQPQFKSRNEHRIGILGDSFSAGVGVERHDRYADIFYRGIRQKLPNVTVWNLSTPISWTGNQAEMLDGVGRHYDLDEVVLAFYGGADLEENCEWSRTQTSAPRPMTGPSKWTRARAWLRKHSRLATFVWVGAIRGFATFRPPGTYSEDDLMRCWPHQESAFTALERAVGSRRLTLLYLPGIPEWSQGAWREMRQRYGVPEATRFLVKTAVKRWAERHAVEFIDATPWLQKCSPASECLLPTDPHWSVRGHQYVGAGLSERWVARSGPRHAKPS